MNVEELRRELYGREQGRKETSKIIGMEFARCGLSDGILGIMIFKYIEKVFMQGEEKLLQNIDWQERVGVYKDC